jgi:hypothetical protein
MDNIAHSQKEKMIFEANSEKNPRKFVENSWKNSRSFYLVDLGVKFGQLRLVFYGYSILLLYVFVHVPRGSLSVIRGLHSHTVT